MLSSVAVLAYPGVSTFGLGVTAEIFGCDRSAEGLPAYDYTITAAAPGGIPPHLRLPTIVAGRPGPPSPAHPGIVLCWGHADRPPAPAARGAGGRAQSGRVLVDGEGAPAPRAARHGWPLQHPHDRVPVADPAARALMPRRPSARQFAARTGTTPRQWLISQRLMRAQEL